MKGEEKKIYVYTTLILMGFCLPLFLFWPREEIPTFSVIGDPNAPTQITLFEEFACPQCKRFHREEFLDHISPYLRTGDVNLTLIPTAFLESSLAPSLALLAVLDADKSYALSMLDFLFQSTSQDPGTLLCEFANINPAFDLSHALEALEGGNFDSILINGRKCCERLYEVEIHMPTLLINGKRIKNLTGEEISCSILRG